MRPRILLGAGLVVVFLLVLGAIWLITGQLVQQEINKLNSIRNELKETEREIVILVADCLVDAGDDQGQPPAGVSGAEEHLKQLKDRIAQAETRLSELEENAALRLSSGTQKNLTKDFSKTRDLLERSKALIPRFERIWKKRKGT